MIVPLGEIHLHLVGCFYFSISCCSNSLGLHTNYIPKTCKKPKLLETFKGYKTVCKINEIH